MGILEIFKKSKIFNFTAIYVMINVIVMAINNPSLTLVWRYINGIIVLILLIDALYSLYKIIRKKLKTVDDVKSE